MKTSFVAKATPEKRLGLHYFLWSKKSLFRLLKLFSLDFGYIKLNFFISDIFYTKPIIVYISAIKILNVLN